MISQEKQLSIVLCTRKSFSYREIARQQGCDWRTAKKYYDHPELLGKKRQSAPRASILEPYMERIKGYLEDNGGNHKAIWIFDQLTKSGYSGGYELVKRAVRKINGVQQQLAYVRFETVPGEQAQVDYGEFIVDMPDGTKKKYYVFAMILGYSRRLFARLFERCDMVSFLDAHIEAFEYFGGVPQDILYDRMRNVYIRTLFERREELSDDCAAPIGVPVFTQSLMGIAVHYGFTPKVAPAYAAWVKGKIERPFQYLRESWWHGYDFVDLETANSDLFQWLAEKEKRVHGTTHERVDARFEREKQYLGALPPQRCDVSERLTRRVNKDCTIAVDGNRYLLPHTLVGQRLTLRVKNRDMRVYSGSELIERYALSDRKGQIIGLDRGYYEALRADRDLAARKYEHCVCAEGDRRRGRKRKGRARIKKTISPANPRFEIIVAPALPQTYQPGLSVDQRSIDIYSQIGGEVSYA